MTKTPKKEKIKEYLDFIPLLILTISAVNLAWVVTTTDIVFVWKHFVGLIFLPLNYFLFFKNHKIGVVAFGLILVISLVSLLSYSPNIEKTTFSIGKSADFQIPIFYGQAIFLLWLLIHFVVSGRFYFGVLTKKYWQDLLQEIKQL
jgi:hypothetical protein